METEQNDSDHCNINSRLLIFSQIRSIYNIQLTTPDYLEKIQWTTEILRNSLQDYAEVVEQLVSNIIHYSCEISCKCYSASVIDLPAVTTETLKITVNYDWLDKAVLVFAAFSVYYGEFWLVAQHHKTTLHKDIVRMIQAIKNVMESVLLFDWWLGVGKHCKAVTVDLSYIIRESPAIFIKAVHWVIESVTICASQIMALIMKNYGTTYAGELCSHIDSAGRLCEDFNKFAKQLKDKIAFEVLFGNFNDTNITRDDKNLFHHLLWTEDKMASIILFGSFDGTKISGDTRILFHRLLWNGEYLPPIYDGSTKKLVSVNVLNNKHVLILITGLDLSHEKKLSILYEIYQESKTQNESPYQILWFPVIEDATQPKKIILDKFKAVQSMMPWYTVDDPSSIHPAALEYIKKEWSFNNKPIIVAVDENDNIVNENALDMIFVWRNKAFPFTKKKEHELWANAAWTIDLLLDIDSNFSQLAPLEEKYICVYGGHDMDLLQKLMTTARDVAKKADVSLQNIYVGKRKPNIYTARNNEEFLKQGLSAVFADETKMWYFWERLIIIWLSRNRLEYRVNDDLISKEIMKILDYDAGKQEWVMFWEGSKEMVMAKSDDFLKWLIKFDEWKEDGIQKGFLPVLNDYLHIVEEDEHNRLRLPWVSEYKCMNNCEKCGSPLEIKYILYNCDGS